MDVDGLLSSRQDAQSPGRSGSRALPIDRPHISLGNVPAFNKAGASGLSANTAIAALHASPLLMEESRARPHAPQSPPETFPLPL